jgi:hypothetical protein
VDVRLARVLIMRGMRVRRLRMNDGVLRVCGMLLQRIVRPVVAVAWRVHRRLLFAEID